MAYERMARNEDEHAMLYSDRKSCKDIFFLTFDEKYKNKTRDSP